MSVTLSCVDDAILVWRKVLMSLTGVSNDKVINGESIRGAELVTIKNGQKVPIGYDETALVFYCDPIEDISIVNTESESNQTAQSYELHVIVYGNDCKKVSQSIKSNLYSQEALDLLRKSGIGLLTIGAVQNTSNFMTSQTYVLRADLRIRFDCVFEDDKAITPVGIETAEIGTEGL